MIFFWQSKLSTADFPKCNSKYIACMKQMKSGTQITEIQQLSKAVNGVKRFSDSESKSIKGNESFFADNI